MSNRIIDLIKKLIKHERSARKCSTPEEAEAFAAKIQQLCIDHKIEAEQLNVDDDAAQQGIGEELFSPSRKKWRGRGVYVSGEDSRLMHVVATAHFCQAIVMAQTNCILVVGEEQDRAVCVEMFQFLRRTMRTNAVKEEAEQRRRRRSIRKFRYYFTLGFTRVIDRRYHELREAADNTTTALVRADALVKIYVTEKYETVPHAVRQPKGRQNNDALFAGMRHGHQVSLATNVVGQSSVVSSQLAGVE
jgi:hypothetical protein